MSKHQINSQMFRPLIRGAQSTGDQCVRCSSSVALSICRPWKDHWAPTPQKFKRTEVALVPVKAFRRFSKCIRQRLEVHLIFAACRMPHVFTLLLFPFKTIPNWPLPEMFPVARSASEISPPDLFVLVTGSDHWPKRAKWWEQKWLNDLKPHKVPGKERRLALS